MKWPLHQANSEYSLTYLDICLLLLKNETEKTIHLIHITDGRTTEPDNREEQRQLTPALFHSGKWRKRTDGSEIVLQPSVIMDAYNEIVTKKCFSCPV